MVLLSSISGELTKIECRRPQAMVGKGERPKRKGANLDSKGLDRVIQIWSKAA